MYNEDLYIGLEDLYIEGMHNEDLYIEGMSAFPKVYYFMLEYIKYRDNRLTLNQSMKIAIADLCVLLLSDNDGIEIKIIFPTMMSYVKSEFEYEKESLIKDLYFYCKRLISLEILENQICNVEMFQYGSYLLRLTKIAGRH